MSEYEFELRFTLASEDQAFDELVERLGEAGCDDAIIGIGLPGQIALTFTREAESAEQAVLTAITDVTQAIPDAKLEEAVPDLVGITDIGRVLDVTRQNVRKLILSYYQSLPPAAVHTGRPTLWHLFPMLSWLRAEKDYPVAGQLLELSWTTMQVNLAVGCLQADHEAQEKYLALLR